MSSLLAFSRSFMSPPRACGMHRLVVAVLVAVVLLPVHAAASDDDDGPQPLPGEARCGFCKTTGRTPYEQDSRIQAEKNHGEGWEVLFSSYAIEADNMGLEWEPCRRCKTPSLQKAAQDEWDSIKKQNDAWLAERRRVDKVAGITRETLVHLETTHFVIAWGLPKLKVERKSLKSYEAAHLYASRLEDLYANFQEMFAIEDKQNLKNKHHIYMFEKLKEMAPAGPVYTGLSGNTTVKRAGGARHESTIVSYHDKSAFASDEDMFRHLTHSMIHQLTSVFYDVHWFKPGELGLTPPWLNDKYGWLDAGLAHWFERRLPGGTDTYCIREQDTTSRWKGSDWHKNIYKAVLAEDVPSFPEVVTKPTQALSAKEHQFCWSWVDYLMTKHETEKMGVALRACKEQKAARDILKDAFGENMLSFTDGWAEWVKTEYAPSNRKGDDVYQPALPLR